MKKLKLSELKIWAIYQVITNPRIRKRVPRLTKLAYKLHGDKFHVTFFGINYRILE